MQDGFKTSHSNFFNKVLVIASDHKPLPLKNPVISTKTKWLLLEMQQTTLANQDDNDTVK